MLVQRDLYADLHLQPTASASDIRTAYRQTALLAHPDKGGSAAAFHSIAFAFEVLSCAASRKLYDQTHRQWLNGRRRFHRSKFAGIPRAKARRPTMSQKAHASYPKRKRESTSAGLAGKRRRVAPSVAQDDGLGQPQCEGKGAGSDNPAPEPQHKGHDTYLTLQLLRVALQDMTPLQRRIAIAHMPPQVRTELLAYMSCHHDASASVSTPLALDKRGVQKLAGLRASLSRGTDVRTIKHIHKNSYQAQLRIRHLRMYTRGEANIETALDHQMVLIRVRQAIEAAGDEVWNNPPQFRVVFNGVLASAGTSQEKLRLSVFIFMRADEWISRSATITSPVMALEDAVAAHSRLMLARLTSWEHLRAEWVPLMQMTHHARVHQLSKAQAEDVAEKARLDLLQRRLKQAVNAAERAIALRRQLEKKVVQTETQLQRRAAKEKIASLRHAVRKRRETWADRRRWYSRTDLSMEEIMQGPPQH